MTITTVPIQITASLTNPSKLQIAFAIAVVKAKPEAISIKEYINTLRQCLRTKIEKEKPSSAYRAIDNVKYWKELFQQMEGLNLELRTRIIELEQRLQSCETTEEFQTQTSRDRMPVSIKRKIERVGGETTARSSKRHKVIRPVAPTTNGILQNDSTVQSYGTIGDSVYNNLLQNLHFFHTLYKESKADFPLLCHHLVQICSNIGKFVSSICDRHQEYCNTLLSSSTKKQQQQQYSGLVKSNEELSSGFRATTRAFSTILLGLSKHVPSQDKNAYGAVIYECVKMYDLLIDKITVTARSQSKLDIKEGASSNEREAKSKAKTKFQRQIKTENVPRAICQLLNAFISSLDPNNTIHKELLEGFTFVLIRHIGQRLFECTFSTDPTENMNRDTFTPSCLRSPARSNSQGFTMEALSLEAPPLISMLERALGLLGDSRYSNSSNVKHPNNHGGIKRTITIRGANRIGKNSLTPCAKERLQHTLVSCMFGKTEGDEFLDILNMPISLSLPQSLPKIQSSDICDWFRAEVWRLIGWEILGRDNDW